MSARIEVYPVIAPLGVRSGEKWGYRVIGANERVLAISVAHYTDHGHAMQGARRLQRLATMISIVDAREARA